MKNHRSRDSTGPLRAIALIFVFWTVMTLAVSIPYVNLGPEEKAPDVRTGDLGSGGLGSTSSGSYLQMLWIVFISIIAGIVIIYTILAILRKDKDYLRTIIGALIVLLIMTGILIGSTYMSDFEMDGASSSFPHRSGDGSASVEDENEQTGESTGYASMVVMMAVVLLAAVIYAVFSALKPEKTEKSPDQTEELMEKIRMAMRDLEEGKKVHDVILQAYDEMCRILAKSGVKEEESMTPREFQEAVIEQTGIRPEPVEKLTELFEEAKYSSHPIDDRKRKEAIIALRDLKKEMESHELEKSGRSQA